MGADLGTYAPAWLKARDEVRRLMERGLDREKEAFVERAVVPEGDRYRLRAPIMARWLRRA